jgi:hypothetical protein
MVHYRNQPVGKEVNVESVFVHAVFWFGQQIYQQGSNVVPVEKICHLPVSRTKAAAAGAV